MEPAVAHGELLAVPERVIIAPAPGRFRPITDDLVRPAGGDAEANGIGEVSDPNSMAAGASDLVDSDTVDREQVIGYVDGIGHSTPVRSPFPGRLMGLLAHAGERVREGQPVAWLRLAH